MGEAKSNKRDIAGRVSATFFVCPRGRAGISGGKIVMTGARHLLKKLSGLLILQNENKFKV